MTTQIKPYAFLHNIGRPIKLDGAAIVEVVTPQQRCPKCNKQGHWRSGQEFDHQLRCADCSSMAGSIIWEPGHTYLMVEIPGNVFPTEKIGLASTGDVTTRDIDILSHYGVTTEENLPNVTVEKEGVNIDLRGAMADPTENTAEIKQQDQALARTGLSKKALDLITLARTEGIGHLKLDGCYDPVNGTIDPSWD